MNSSIILASRSPWRKRLLARHGIFCKIHVSRFREMKPTSRFHKNPRKMVLYNAIGKALAVARQSRSHSEAGRGEATSLTRPKGATLHAKNAIIIGVDTVGVLRGKIFGKPRNRADAENMLKKLFGKTHRVITGLCIVNEATKKKFTSVVTTQVTFRKVTPRELKDYLDSGEWKGKAGSYAIQGRAKKFVEKIKGDVTNVVGIPISVLKSMLKGIKNQDSRTKNARRIQ